MDRYRRQVRLRRDSGFPKKRDTPLKPTRWRRDRNRRLLPNKHFDTLVEECEDGGTSFSTGRRAGAVLANTAPLHRVSVSCFKPCKKTATPINRQKILQTSNASNKASPILQSFGAGDTPESVTSFVMETSSTSNSEEHGDSRSSSTSTNLSSYPSPEIFRREVETQTFLNGEEMLGIICNVKNSTLLDESHSKSIHTYHPPNMSTIIDVSTHVAEKNSESSYQKETHTENKSQEMKPAQDFVGRRPIVCRKRVSFKSPVISEPLKEKHAPSPSGINDTIRKLSRVSERTKPDAQTPKMDEISSKKEITVTPKRPVETEKTMFFDFTSNADMDALFQNMRDRSAKLRCSFYFPFTVGTQSPLRNKSRSELT
ncbi:uncharacterized protein LOC101165494 isoform X2 [Oryzias latipes]|uniref:uncharacterized protein LOC101165494 isoform X2 n=1 Tax=Oryzias latipes TaxID=8090 RepID=UPI0005CC3D95|nr:uncharacterized protein LOC101165494 isoform X2 [Oryzias latipes]